MFFSHVLQVIKNLRIRASIMGESKQTRVTKNSQKVATLAEQNKILEEVLKKSREANLAKNKEKTSQEKGFMTVDEKEQTAGGSPDGDKKRKAEGQPKSQSPVKRAKTDVLEAGSQETPIESGKRQILEYPDYEANREDDFNEGSSDWHPLDTNKSQAGKQTSVSSERRRKQRTNTC